MGENFRPDKARGGRKGAEWDEVRWMDGWMDVIEATEVIVISMRDFPSAKVGCSRDGVTPPVVGSRAVVRTLFDAYHFLFRGFPARHPPPTLLHRLYVL